MNRGVGSTCTLVTERYLSAPEGAGARLDATVAKLLLAVILLDTQNLDPSKGKTTEQDIAAVEALRKVADVPDTAALFKDMCAQKFSPTFWASLSLPDCLKLDYKQFRQGDVAFGVSSVLVSLRELLAKSGPGTADDLAAFCAAKGLRFWMGMTAVLDDSGTLNRQLAVYAPGPDGGANPHVHAVVEHLLGSDLELEPLPGVETDVGAGGAGGTAGGAYFRTFAQHNSKASRKQVVPLVVDALP